MEFQLSYFKSYKIIPLKCCTQYASKFENSAVATRLGKISFHSSLKEGQCPKCPSYHAINLFSHGGKVMLKGHQEQYVNEELQMFKLDLEKAGNQTANIHWILEKARDSGKTSTSASLTVLKPLTVRITNWKILKEMEIPDCLTCLLRNLYAGQDNS